MTGSSLPLTNIYIYFIITELGKNTQRPKIQKGRANATKKCEVANYQMTKLPNGRPTEQINGHNITRPFIPNSFSKYANDPNYHNRIKLKLIKKYKYPSTIFTDYVQILIKITQISKSTQFCKTTQITSLNCQQKLLV